MKFHIQRNDEEGLIIIGENEFCISLLKKTISIKP